MITLFHMAIYLFRSRVVVCDLNGKYAWWALTEPVVVTVLCQRYWYYWHLMTR